MEALQGAISSLKSGPRLLGLLRETGLKQEDLACAIQLVLDESAKPKGETFLSLSLSLFFLFLSCRIPDRQHTALRSNVDVAYS